MTNLSPFQLLEINLISAQDIYKVSRSMQTYATAWVHPDRMLTTRVDIHGGTNPTWNDKFVFRVDNQFLRSDTSAIMIEIHALHWFRNVHIGTVRVLVGNLIPPQTRSYNQNHLGMRFVALQVRRPSGRPQGILNVGITILDSTMRSMPLYTQLSTSAVGYQKLMGQDDLHSHQQSSSHLRRTKSERSSIIVGNDKDEYDDHNYTIPKKPNSSIINEPSNSSNKRENQNQNQNQNHVYDKPLSIIDGSENASSLNLAMKLKAQEGKAESVISYSPASSIKLPNMKAKQQQQQNNNNQEYNKKHNWLPNFDVKKDLAAGGSIWSESEVGPSPSEVAAAVAEDRRRFDDRGSSIIMNGERGSSIAESEGLRTKLERWRSEMPSKAEAYGGSYGGSSISSSTIFPKTKHNRRHTTESGGKFSCFGNICGYECSIVCGRDDYEDEQDDDHNNNMKKGAGKRKYVARAPSIDSVSTYF